MVDTEHKDKQVTEQEFKYYAFISYNSKDIHWGKRLQRKLEHYRLPATICSERGWKRKPIRPVFFAPTDIQPGELSDELKERLKASRNLIVVCSPNSAKSEWVGKEIEFYHNLGRGNHIYFFIVEGQPNSDNPDTECYHPITKKLGLSDILGANVNERAYRWPWLNRERAYVQLVSKLLGLEFDSIWKRDRRRLVRNLLLWILGCLTVFATLVAVWLCSQPFKATISLNEVSAHNDQLPPLSDAVVTLTLDNETKVDTITAMNSQAVFSNIPHRYLHREVRMTMTCRDFMPVDTIVNLSQELSLNIYRDPSVYGDVQFDLWDPHTETPIPNFAMSVEGIETHSDTNGHVSIFIPLESQRTSYHIVTGFPLKIDSVKMPCFVGYTISKR